MRFIVRSLSRNALALGTLALAGCGTSLPDTDSLVVDVKVQSAAAGAALPFSFANTSSEQVVTGALDCVVTYEQRVAGRWVPMPPLRACIDLAELHPPGSERGYTTVAPDAGGLWRLVVEAWTGSGPGRVIVTTRSQGFVVLGED